MSVVLGIRFANTNVSMIGLSLSIISLHLSGAISISVPGRLVLSLVHMGTMCQSSNRDI